MHQNRHYDAADSMARARLARGGRGEATPVPYGCDGDPCTILHHHPDSEPWCECDWLGVGTPRHEPSSMCRALRPDGPRSA